ncbi:ankyrin repeat and SOCS box protein 12-like isoform X1 [Oratosquilla oratoria]|uniref:ankyrin repeat and SOCS box protein 12-like isoform X1 n=1 Tax=Oratosquilla oratoria TaxID=337810 RepID=UPI003F76F741
MSVAWNISPQVDIMNLMVDTDEDEDVRLHRAALTNDAATLRTLLEEPGYENWIDYRVRPYLAPPLRLAVSGDSLECVNVLLSARCDIDLEDIKGQTPLFVATSLRKAAIMRALLDAGANPEGSSKNRTSPLLIAVRDGFVEGVEILLEYGADTEPLEHLKTCIPGWPLQHAVVYAHFSSFLVMLRGGACADLKKLPRTPESKVIARLSIPHTVLKYARNFPEFINLYHECGGNLRQVDLNGALSSEVLIEDSPAREALLLRIGSPLSLKSLCRLKVRSQLTRKRLPSISQLDIPLCLAQFLNYSEFECFAKRTKENLHVKIPVEE